MLLERQTQCFRSRCTVRSLVPRTVRNAYYFLYGTHFPLVDNMQATEEGPIEEPIINWKGGSHMNPAQVHAHGPLNINK